MIVYNIAFVMITLMAVIMSCALKRVFWRSNNSLIIDNKINVDLVCRALFCVVVFGYLIFLSTQRYDIGYDFFQYTIGIKDVAKCSSLSEAIKLHSRYEWGYVCFEFILSRLVSSSVAVLFVNALIVIGLFGLGVLLFSKSVYISAVLFIALDFFAISMNFNRHAIAMAISFVGWGLLRKKKIIPSLILSVVALSFHLTSAIIIALMIFVCIKRSKKIYLFVAAVGAISFILSDKLIELAFLIFPQYNGYRDSLYLEKSGETYTFIILLVISLIIMLCYAFTEWKKREYTDIYFAIAFITIILLFFAKKYYIFDRFVSFLLTYYIYIIPDMLEYLYLKSKKYGVKFIATDKADKSLLLRAISSVLIIVVVMFTSLYNFSLSSSKGAHKVYPYNTANMNIITLMNPGKTTEEILKTTSSIPAYLSVIGDEDYIVLGTYSGNGYDMWIKQNAVYDEYNGRFFSRYGLQADYNMMRIGDSRSNGAFIIDGAKSVVQGPSKRVDYAYNTIKFSAINDTHNSYINIDGRIFQTSPDSICFAVYSKSRNEIVDITTFEKTNLIYSFLLFHRDYDALMINENKLFDDMHSFEQLLSSMTAYGNKVFITLNNEDMVENISNSKLLTLFYQIGAKADDNILSNNNYCSVYIDGQWYEDYHSDTSSEISLSIGDKKYEIKSDSYRSYIKIDGEDVSSAQSGLNILVLSESDEVLFNGMIDVYGDYSLVRY